MDLVGLTLLIDLIGATRKSGRAIHMRLCDYFPNEPNLNAMFRATVRAMFPNATSAAGEEAYHLQRVLRQLDDYVII